MASWFYVIAGPSTPSSSGSRLELRGIRRWLDAKTRDYVVEGGRLKDDTGFTSKVVLAWATRLGSCQAFPAFGSRLHEVKTADERGRKLAERHALAAIQHLTEEIIDLKVTATISAKQPGVIELVASGRRGEKQVAARYTAVI